MPAFFGDVPRTTVVVGIDNGQQWEYPAEELNITTSQRNWDDSLQSCRGDEADQGENWPNKSAGGERYFS